jgi:Hypothetical protein (DUF2513)
MKRDMDLCRKILLELEKLSFEPGFQYIEVEGYSEEDVSYHVYLLQDAGLINAQDMSSGGGSSWFPVSIRWQGHEFLNAARDNNRWEKAKGAMAKAGGVVLPVLMQLLTQYLKAELKLP